MAAPTLQLIVNVPGKLGACPAVDRSGAVAKLGQTSLYEDNGGTVEGLVVIGPNWIAEIDLAFASHGADYAARCAAEQNGGSKNGMVKALRRSFAPEVAMRQRLAVTLCVAKIGRTIRCAHPGSLGEYYVFIEAVFRRG